MLANYAQHYEDLWNRHWWWQSRKHFVLRFVRQIAQKKKLHHILDIGCGNGLFFDDLSTFGSVQGIEPDASLVPPPSPESKWAKSIAIRGFDHTYVPDANPELVLMLDVLEHIQDHQAAAQSVHDLLTPGGYYIVTVPALMSLWSMHDVANQHFRRYRKHELRTVLQTAGFQVESIGYFFGWSVFPMLLRRLFSPGKSIDADPSKYEVHIPPAIINSAMYSATRLEQCLTPSCGLPVGSSVFAVARKAK